MVASKGAVNNKNSFSIVCFDVASKPLWRASVRYRNMGPIIFGHPLLLFEVIWLSYMAVVGREMTLR